MRKKVTVVGAGHVGATLVQRIAETRLADVVMVDVAEGVPQGKGLDLMEAGPVLGYDTKITGTNGYDETAGSDIIVITAGLARKPGMSRDDLLAANGDIVKKVAAETGSRSPKAVMIVVTNPMDVMAYVAMKASGFPKERVIGMGGVLDSARFRTFIAMELGVSVENTHAFVLGGHGDTMVPLPRYSSVAGIPITELMSADRSTSLSSARGTAAPRSSPCSRPEARTTLRRRPRSRWSRPSCWTRRRSFPVPHSLTANTASRGCSPACR